MEKVASSAEVWSHLPDCILTFIMYGTFVRMSVVGREVKEGGYSGPSQGCSTHTDFESTR